MSSSLTRMLRVGKRILFLRPLFTPIETSLPFITPASDLATSLALLFLLPYHHAYIAVFPDHCLISRSCPISTTHCSHLPAPSQPAHAARHSLSLNNCFCSVNQCNTSQFSRCFIPPSLRLWNAHPNEIVNSSNCET